MLTLAFCAFYLFIGYHVIAAVIENFSSSTVPEGWELFKGLLKLVAVLCVGVLAQLFLD